MANLIPMSLAPETKEDILAFHNCGEFQIVWLDPNSKEYKMMWNLEYSQPKDKFKGWLKLPKSSDVH
jgi:hypothetical protein